MYKYLTRRDDGVLYARLPDVLDQPNINAFVDEYSAVINKETDSARILIDATHLSKLPTLSDQKFLISELKEKVREALEDEKAVLVVSTNIIFLTAARSVLSLAGYSNIKIMKSISEAEDYLKD